MNQANDTSAAWTGYRSFVVERTEDESETVTSFYLVPEDGGPLPGYKPGQFFIPGWEICEVGS